MNVIFYGTPEFAVPSLDALARHDFRISAVVTVPDKPAGRGRHIWTSPVKQYALANGLKLLQPEKLRDPVFLKELSDLQPDLQVVVAFRMLPAVVWQAAPMGTFNLHASLLPQYRGAAPINRAIINGERETGLTTFFINENIDTGKILLRQTIQIDDNESAGELHDRMMEAGAGLLLKTAIAIRDGLISPVDQMDTLQGIGELKTAPKITKEDCMINWDARPRAVHNFIRGLSPYPAAFSNLISPDGQVLMVKVYSCKPEASPFFTFPGDILTDGRSYLKVSVRGGFVEIGEIQVEGRKRMGIDSFLRGFDMKNHWKFAQKPSLSS